MLGVHHRQHHVAFAHARVWWSNCWPFCMKNACVDALTLLSQAIVLVVLMMVMTMLSARWNVASRYFRYYVYAHRNLQRRRCLGSHGPSGTSMGTKSRWRAQRPPKSATYVSTCDEPLGCLATLSVFALSIRTTAGCCRCCCCCLIAWFSMGVLSNSRRRKCVCVAKACLITRCRPCTAIWL